MVRRKRRSSRGVDVKRTWGERAFWQFWLRVVALADIVDAIALFIFGDKGPRWAHNLGMSLRCWEVERSMRKRLAKKLAEHDGKLHVI